MKIVKVNRSGSVLSIKLPELPVQLTETFWTIGDDSTRIDSERLAISKAKKLLEKQSGFPVIYVYEFAEIKLTEEERLKAKMTSSEFYLANCHRIQKERNI